MDSGLSIYEYYVYIYYLPHDAVKECLRVVGVVHGQLGLLPLQFELVMSTLKRLFREDADPVAWVPLVDLGDDVCQICRSIYIY